MRGLVAWLGLKEAVIPFDRGPRSAGVTKYPWWKMLRFAWTAICSFSALPLRISLAGGVAVTLFGFGYLGYTFFRVFVDHATVPGWSSLVSLHIIFSGATLLAIGLAGDYVARLYDEAKGRPSTSSGR